MDQHILNEAKNKAEKWNDDIDWLQNILIV